MKTFQTFFVLLSLFFTMLFSINVNAMSKKQAVRLCLKELNIQKKAAKQCKDSSWGSSECKNLHRRIKPCVKAKILRS